MIVLILFYFDVCHTAVDHSVVDFQFYSAVDHSEVDHSAVDFQCYSAVDHSAVDFSLPVGKSGLWVGPY